MGAAVEASGSADVVDRSTAQTDNTTGNGGPLVVTDEAERQLVLAVRKMMRDRWGNLTVWIREENGASMVEIARLESLIYKGRVQTNA